MRNRKWRDGTERVVKSRWVSWESPSNLISSALSQSMHKPDACHMWHGEYTMLDSSRTYYHVSSQVKKQNKITMRYHTVTVMLPQRQNTAWVPGFVSTTVLSLLLSIQHSYWEHMVCQSLWGSMNRFFHYHQLALRDNIWVELISIGRNLQLNGSSRNYRKTSRCETGRSRSRGLSCCAVQFIQEGLGSAAEDNGDSFTVNRALVLRRSMDSHVQRKVF